MGENGVVTVHPRCGLIDLAGTALCLQERRDGLGAEEAAERHVSVGAAHDKGALAVTGRHRLGVALLYGIRGRRVIAAASSAGEHLAGAGATRGRVSADQWIGHAAPPLE